MDPDFQRYVDFISAYKDAFDLRNMEAELTREMDFGELRAWMNRLANNPEFGKFANAEAERILGKDTQGSTGKGHRAVFVSCD